MNIDFNKIPTDDLEIIRFAIEKIMAVIEDNIEPNPNYDWQLYTEYNMLQHICASAGEVVLRRAGIFR